MIIGFWAAAVVCAFEFLNFKWLAVPWQPITVLGTAVAFYLGFKNNSAYSRTWEARKIWGAIVNSSRTWGIMARDFVTDEYSAERVDQREIHAIRQRLIYRHIAWLYRLKRQLRVLKGWEHNRPLNHARRERIAKDFPWAEPSDELSQFIGTTETEALLKKRNVATQLLANQSEDLRHLKRRGLIDDFRHMELEKMLADFYTQQGKCERIKNFPLPRQYASTSYYFVLLFIFLLPMGILSTFHSFDPRFIWGTIPFTMLLGIVFWMMELVGDYAENPFENLAFDTPMDSLTRTIEIDLRQMLDETEVPAPITPVDNYVM